MTEKNISILRQNQLIKNCRLRQMRKTFFVTQQCDISLVEFWNFRCDKTKADDVSNTTFLVNPHKCSWSDIVFHKYFLLYTRQVKYVNIGISFSSSICNKIISIIVKVLIIRVLFLDYNNWKPNDIYRYEHQNLPVNGKHPIISEIHLIHR